MSKSYVNYELYVNEKDSYLYGYSVSGRKLKIIIKLR